MYENVRLRAVVSNKNSVNKIHYNKSEYKIPE